MKARTGSKKEGKSFRNLVVGVEKYARKKAFKNDMPYAISRNGQVILVYPDQHTEQISPERLKDLSK